jgi:hypothetical protein
MSDKVIAMLIKENMVTRSGAVQSLYKLSRPVDNGCDGTTEHVIVSATYVLGVPETYIFPSDADGAITSWLELDGSYRGGTDHEQALRGAGWEVAPAR